MEKKLRIGIVFEGELVNKFYALQKRYGIQSKSDLCRFLISDAFDKLGRKGATTTDR